MRRSTIAQGNASIVVPPGSRVVVTGGTQGIGEGVAYRFAKAGAGVWIAGRNETKANAVLTRLREISQEQKAYGGPSPEHHFTKADLSLVSEAHRVADDIRVRAGEKGIDYLVMCHGGFPSGIFTPTSEGHDQHYVAQVLSRFVLAYKLALYPSPVVKKGVMSIKSPGKTWMTTDYDDLELLNAKEEGQYGIAAVASRDSNVIDAFTEELAERNPGVTFTHVFPGFVKTDCLRNAGAVVPWYISAITNTILAIAGSSPESYAEVPFYLLANPEGQAIARKVRFLNENAGRAEPHASAMDKKSRKKVWEHLLLVMQPSARLGT